jgi:hypothetical protein
MKAIRIKSNAFCANVINRNGFRQLPTNLPRCGKSWEQICSRFSPLGCAKERCLLTHNALKRGE